MLPFNYFKKYIYVICCHLIDHAGIDSTRTHAFIIKIRIQVILTEGLNLL